MSVEAAIKPFSSFSNWENSGGYGEVLSWLAEMIEPNCHGENGLFLYIWQEEFCLEHRISLYMSSGKIYF